MREESERSGDLMPARENVGVVRETAAAARPSESRLLAIEVGIQMEEMDRSSGATGSLVLPSDALARLRRWQFDPRLDCLSRQRASGLVWKFEPNGWDEV